MRLIVAHHVVTKDARLSLCTHDHTCRRPIPCAIEVDTRCSIPTSAAERPDRSWQGSTFCMQLTFVKKP
jgi:hypothetical protein